MGRQTAKIPGLEIEDVREGRILVVSVVGRILREDYDRAVEAFRDALVGRRAVVVDGSRAEFLSSSGVGALVYYSRQVAQAGGLMVVVKPPESVIARVPSGVFGGAVRTCDTREEAVAILEAEVLS
jgi:anti-anti-sigma regulatory factor